MTLYGCRSLTDMTASSSCIVFPAFWPCAINALMSFGKQLPPNPQPASR